jgi:hypothetical protein
VDAAFMLQERHELGIHAVWAGPREGSLKIVATLAALPDGDVLSVPRLQDMVGLPPGRLIIGLRELGRAGYVRAGKTGGGRAQSTAALTCDGRVALDRARQRRPSRLRHKIRQLPPTTRSLSTA